MNLNQLRMSNIKKYKKMVYGMNLNNQMIIIDGEIVTQEISYIKYNVVRKVYAIKYKRSNKFYNYPLYRIKHLKNPTVVSPNDYKFYFNNKLLEEIKNVYEFKVDNFSYYHVVFNNNSFKDFKSEELKKISKDSYDAIEYMKEVANITSLMAEGGKKILCEQMEKIKIDSLDTALANYLNLSSDLSSGNTLETLIFPFGCNSSQYEAVENAIYNKVSVIEGPPGTGKTQTILNIIANIIIRNMNCQVVSNNNAAIENIVEKLKKYNLDFFTALLGKSENKKMFIKEQNPIIPNFDDINISIEELSKNITDINLIVKQVYKAKKELAKLIQYKNEIELEFQYFKELIKSRKIELIDINKYNKSKIKLLWNEIICIDKLSFFDKLKYVFLYKTGTFKFYKNDIDIIVKSLQNIVYMNDIDELNLKIKEKEEFINLNKNAEDKFIKWSMDYFKKYLFIKYKDERKKYSQKEIWSKGDEFLRDYPVILSTTYSSRNTLNNDFKFDYIIMDESSQIDLVTGTLALSSAKCAVIIGDEKQLTNVVKDNIKRDVNKIFNKYNLEKNYSYSLNSFLTSVKNTIIGIPSKMLVEHYRCHPKIINFCNKEFYNNELVIMTKDSGENDVIKVIRTNKGNHSRDYTSQRQIDIIKDFIQNLTDEEIGVITPYNNQIELFKENIENVEVSTVHKFQGREKDTIIISTVDDKISDFVGDPKILNVAISRAKKHLYFIVTGNGINNPIINDFIDYVNYNNMEIENSKIYSSFDLLYSQYDFERLMFFKKRNRILKYDSENIIFYLIDKILKDYNSLNFHFHYSLNDLIKDKSLLDENESKYCSHKNTHLDFLIFNNNGKRPILAIEVDGYKSHKRGTKQYERDLLKDSILKKYDIPLIRLKTNGSSEESKIRKKLDEIMKVE